MTFYTAHNILAQPSRSRRKQVWPVLLLLYFIFAIVLPNDLVAQDQFCMNIGGAASDQGHSMVQAADGGYAIAGQTNSSGAGGNDMYVVKISNTGSVEWTRTIGGAGNDVARGIVKTYDGGFAVAGWTASFGAGGDDFYIAKLDAAGTLLWTRTVGGTGSDQGWEIIQTADSGLAIAGQTSSFGGSPNDMYLVKLDRFGVFQWDKRVGASSIADQGYSLIQSSDGGYVIAGTAYNWTGSAGTSSNDFYVVKVDGTGTLVWTRHIRDTNVTPYPDYARSVIQTSDGGYMVAGEAPLPKGGGYVWHFLLAKLTSAGAVSWIRYYGGSAVAGVSADNSDYAESVIQTADGGYIAAGWSFSFNYNFSTGQSVGNEFLLMKVNSAGVLQWSKVIGDTAHNVAKTVVQTTDGGLAIAGYSYPLAGGANEEVYFVKMDAAFVTCCTTRTIGYDRGTGTNNTTRGAANVAGATSSSGGASASGGGSSRMVCPTILPVNLTGFSARWVKGEIHLAWQPANEMDVEWFIIERATASDLYEEIGWVRQDGQMMGGEGYTLVDPSPAFGINRYRIKMIDSDGGWEYSQVISMASPGTFEGMSYEVFPQPCSADELMVSGQGEYQGEIGLELLDLQGRVVRTSSIQVMHGAWSHSIAFDKPDELAGFYLLRIISGEQVSCVRLVISP